MISTLCRLAFLMATTFLVVGGAVFTLRFPAFVGLVVLFLAWRRFRRWRTSGWSHGSATTATLPVIERAKLLEDKGLIVGRCPPQRPTLPSAVSGLLSTRLSSDAAARRFLAASLGPQWYEDRMLRVSDFVHLATFAPAGAGKGVSVLVPNLLSWAGNCVVVDPKGELFSLTAEHRRKKFGHRIIRLDPFHLKGPGGDSLNPCEFIDEKSDQFLDFCRDLANMLIVRTGQEKDPHWNDSAELILAAFLSFVCGCEANPTKRNLSTVRRLAGSKASYEKALEVMQQVTGLQGVVRQQGGSLTWLTGEELGSVQSTFQRQTAFIESPLVARNIATSSFDPMILRKGKATVYLILPAERLVSLAPLQRMWIGTIMNVITRGVPTERNPVLWLLDEMAHIGRMQAIEDAVTLKRGMGMRLWFFFQSQEQLKTCFGDKATTVLDNIATLQYFAINSFDTADYISKRIGDATISVRTGGTSTTNSHPTGSVGTGGAGGNFSTSSNQNVSDTSRRLLKPEEILTLPRDTALVFHKNLPVITGRLLRYFNAPEFAGRRHGKTSGPGSSRVV